MQLTKLTTLATRLALLLVMFCLVGVIYTNRAQAQSINAGFKNISNVYVIGDERVRFKALFVTTSDNAQLDRIARATTDESGSHIWDDKWYWVSLPDNRAKYLLCVWKNLNSGEMGWAFVQNTPSTWWTKTNSNGFVSIPNGGKRKWTWHTNGRRIDIDIQNPKNSGWTADDIWYGFGF